MTASFDKYDDIISVEAITDRVEELCAELDQATDRTDWIDSHPDESSELATLESLLSDLKGMGGDHQWRGDWYPGSMVRDSYFKDYAMELADDIGAVPANAAWPMTCIDWDQAARELRMDYSWVEFEDVTYWVR